MDNIIEVKNVSKNFRETRALDNISLDFERGKIHGIIGRNGSGKTVLMKCICGFMTPTSGEVLVNGEKVRPSKAQENIGLIIETPGFIGGKSGLRNLQYLLRLRGKSDRSTVENAMRAVGLDPENKKPVRKYSPAHAAPRTARAYPPPPGYPVRSWARPKAAAPGPP